LSQVSRFTLDELGFTIGATNPLGQADTFALDVMRRLTNSVDALQRADRFTYDPRGDLASATAPVIGTASYLHNDLGLLTRITGLNAEQWHFGYSPMGRLQFLADPLNRTNRFDYDNRGRQTTTTFADGTTLTNTFDGAGNVMRQQFSAGPDLVYAYDKVNRLTNAADVALAYDADGRLTNTLSAGVNYGATYDAGGRLASVRYHDGAFTVTYTYNSQNQLIGVNDSLTSTFLQLVYDPAGRLINITRPNAVNSTYTYDDAGRLTRVQDGTIVDVQYTLDAAGQVAMAGFNAPLDPAVLITNTQSSPFIYDAAHQINSAGFNYDARGRLIASPGNTFTWDGASRLTGIGAVALSYNGLGDLITRTEGGATTRYFYNYAVGLAPIMAERNETTMQVQRYYVWTPGGRLLYLIDAANGNAVRHYHVDRVGSTLALTSAAGAVTDAYAYTPYGELLGRTGTSAQPFTYVGAYGVRSEPAANLYHMRARYYDPLSARFLSREPIWPVLGQPRGLDPYQYAYGEPMRFIDRTGLDVEEAGGSTLSPVGAVPRPQVGSTLSPVGAVPIRYGGSTLSPVGAVPISEGTGSGNRVGYIHDYSVVRVGYVHDYARIRVGYIHDYSRIVQRDRAASPSPFSLKDLNELHRSYLMANRLSGGLAEYILRQFDRVWKNWYSKTIKPKRASDISLPFPGFQASAAWGDDDSFGVGSTSANNLGSVHVGSVLDRNECPKEAEAAAKRLDAAIPDGFQVPRIIRSGERIEW
jgi:RHS repeat-associated protein